MESLAYGHIMYALKMDTEAEMNVPLTAGCSWDHMVAGLALALAMTSTTPGMVLAADGNLMFGSEGAEVAKLQYQLSVLGYFEGCTTGFFGEKTEVSVIQFQSDWGLVVDGVVGPQTYEILFRPDRGDPSPAETSGGGATIVDNPNTLEIQSHLQALGYYQGSIDGIYGPLTARAVGDFQADRGLVVDGIAGSQTMAALGQGESEGTGQGSTAIPLEDIIVLPPPPPPAWL